MSAPELFLNTPPNGFDNLVVDVAELHRKFPVDRPMDLGLNWSSAIDRLYATPLLPLANRGHAWQLLRRVRLDLTWF